MDYKTKEYYRNEIKLISEAIKISELYIAKKIVEIAESKDNKKERHIGYYLISKGREELNNKLGVKGKKKTHPEQKVRRYIVFIYLITSLLSMLTAFFIYLGTKSIIGAIINFIILYIPISEVVIQIINNILNKKVKPCLIPKLDFEHGIPKEYSTFVVIPTIVNSKEKVQELMKKLEVYYLANKSENLYFALLGDCTSGQKEVEKVDNEIIEAGIEEVNKLNKKYNSNSENEIPKFNFLYRKRIWNKNEGGYLGWERKRGLLCEFNDFLINGNDKFRINTIVGANCVRPQKNIKYVITLDSDTNLTLDSGLNLIGAMAHVLNEPILDRENRVVIDGHALIQPRVGVNLEDSRKSFFAKVYSGTRRNRFLHKCYIRYISRQF
ncbi:MAG: hypothetical protein IJN50_00430 [Clostridia bacterium]|nr:hypothetical protein [Clostridia bacterium]